MLSTTSTNISFSASCSETDATGVSVANFNANYSNGRVYFNIDVNADADMEHVMKDFNDFTEHVLDTVANV